MDSSVITKEWIENKFDSAIDTWKQSHPESKDEKETANREAAFKLLAELKVHCLEINAKINSVPEDSDEVKEQKKAQQNILYEIGSPVFIEFGKEMVASGKINPMSLFSNMLPKSQGNQNANPGNFMSSLLGPLANALPKPNMEIRSAKPRNKPMYYE